MPFVQRVVDPKYLSRTSLWDDDGKPKVSDGELEAVTNNTLSNALRQLASVLLVADDIFKVLGGDLQQIAQRSQKLKKRMNLVEEKVAAYDPKKVTVPEGDISSFALLKHHYAAKQDFTTNLFSVETRPNAVEQLYRAAVKTPVHLMRQMDKWRKDGHRSSKFFLCTPVLGRRKKLIRSKVDIDIETSLPAAVEELRRWTSNEALGDVTISTDCQSRIPNLTTGTDGDVTDGTILADDEAIDHKLPSPEEQQHVIALKFPPEVVAVDVTGRNFDRMSMQRRSLLHTETEDGSTIRRKTKSRRSRSKRRNTLAGTDEKEIVDALGGGEEIQPVQLDVSAPPTVGVVNRSKSSDLLRSSSKKDSPETKKSHFDSLKQWGKNRLKMLNKYTESKSPDSSKKEEEEFNLYETVTVKRKKNIEKERKILHQRQASCSSSEKSSIATPQVKLRDSSLQRRLRRSGENKDEPHSSSGNWSASSESGRASIGSEITTHPKSSTSAATSINSLNIHPPGSVNSKRRYNTSTSGSVTSEGTLTPDIIHDLHEDGETSSVYSCDTEGYYTSFHMDSGLKTLKEEDSPQTPQHSTTVFTNSSTSTVLTAENEYELFGRGSTSTTTSSAGTVCTTLRASCRSINLGPAVPERKSSLNKDKSPGSSLERDCSSSDKTGTVKRSPLQNKATVVAVIHKNGDVSPDSGHNTSNSPIESINSPSGNRSCSEFEFSESSDMEGTERIERIRVKTTINSSRIPSMCAITPPQSDDESIQNFDTIREKNQINQKRIEEIDVVDANLDGLDILKQTTTWNNKLQLININPKTGYATIENIEDKIKEHQKSPQPILKSTLLPLNNMLGKIKTNWNNLSSRKLPQETCHDDGDYVTIADVKNNNDMVNRNLKTVLSGKIKETEYVSLNELPINESFDNSLDRNRRQGARVTLNADGKVVYTSDSLPRRKSTTFEPGPFVKAKDSPTVSPVAPHRNLNIRPANIAGVSTPLSPQLGKVVIRANSGMLQSPTSEVVRMQPSTIVRPMSPKSTNSRAGAYVHMLDTQSDKDEGQAVSPTTDYTTHGKMMETDLHGRNYPQRGTYNTLPAKRTSYVLNEPDITRDLGSRRYETLGPVTVGRVTHDYRKVHFDAYQEIGIPVQGHNFGKPVQMPNIAPNRNMSSQRRDHLDESLKISPIDPRHEAGFKSSTPSGRTEMKSSVNLSSLLSPKKSTMSNDELYAVIHKSKKKLNITDTFEAVEPTNSETTKKLQNPESGYLDKAKSRLSWSPSSSNETNKDVKRSPKNESRSRQSWAVPDKKPNSQTSRLDFKRLLLQHCRPNLPPSNAKLSAVEQLKISKQQPQSLKLNDGDVSILELSRSPRSIGHRKLYNPPPASLPKTPEKVRPTPKILSPRSQWRFASPRSDVLSSTILEDCREDDSPNSSTERRKSPQQINSTNVTDNNCRSISQKLQTRRAQFFNTDRNTKENPEKPVLPTLETAF